MKIWCNCRYRKRGLTFQVDIPFVTFLSDEGPTLKTFDFAFHPGSTRTFIYFDLYLNTANAGHNVYFINSFSCWLTLHVLLTPLIVIGLIFSRRFQRRRLVLLHSLFSASIFVACSCICLADQHRWSFSCPVRYSSTFLYLPQNLIALFPTLWPLPRH